MISLGYRDQQIAQIYKTYDPETPWPKEIVLYRQEFLVFPPVLAMISNATHGRWHQFNVAIVFETFRKEAWNDVVDTNDLPFVRNISLFYAKETNADYLPDFVDDSLSNSTIKQLRRDFSMPDVLKRWNSSKNNHEN